MLVCNQDEYISRWVADKIEDVDDFGTCKTIGIATETKLIAGSIYHNYYPRYESIEWSFASISPMWAKPDNIRFLLAYPFEQLKCFRVYSVIRLNNKKAQKAISHIGFKREAICHSLFGENKHAVIYRMLQPEFRKIYGDIDGRNDR